jgi:hypothetical protein
MNIRHSASALGFAIALVTPLAALADGFWETTNDETGSRLVAPQFGTIARTAPLPSATALQPGAVSSDRQYVFLGEAAGWELRPMQFAFVNGRLEHVDDPAGHMSRVADTRPLTEQQRLTLERSAGR